MARRPSLTPRPPLPTQDLRERILADFTVLRIPLTAAHLDAALAQAAQDGCSHVEFLHRLLTDQAGLRRERSTARRLREALLQLARERRRGLPHRIDHPIRGLHALGETHAPCLASRRRQGL